MEQYKSFIHYLQINYKDKIEEHLEAFLNKKGKEFLELNKDVYGFKCLNTNIVHYEFTKSELNNVEFDVYFTVEINAIIAQSPEAQYNELDSKIFKTHMKGNFEAGFEFSKSKLEKVNRKPFKENLTYNLVHVIKKDKMDQYASKFLEYFCPEALKTPMKLNIEEMYKAKGIKFYRAPLTSDVYGKTYFADDIAEVYDDEGIPKRIDITRGTILINSKKADQGIGAERNTLIHEGVHYFYHGNYFDLMFALDNSKTCSIYKKGDSENLDIKWMEHQASKLAPLILKSLKNI